MDEEKIIAIVRDEIKQILDRGIIEKIVQFHVGGLVREFLYSKMKDEIESEIRERVSIQVREDIEVSIKVKEK